MPSWSNLAHDRTRLRNTRRVLCVLSTVVLAVVSLGWTEKALASTPPLTVGGLTAQVTGSNLLQPTIALSWMASTDPDGNVVGYTVRYIEGAGGDAVDAGSVSVPSAVIGPIRRGMTYRVFVRAVDNAGDLSDPEEVSLAVPAITTTSRILQVTGKALKPCTRPCTRLSVDATSLTVTALPLPQAQQGRRVSVRLWHRVPGSSKLRAAGTLSGSLNADGQVRLPLKRSVVARRSGLWCMKASIAATPSFSSAETARSCLRYRPPVMLGWSGDMTLGSSYGHPPSGGARLLNAVDELLRQPDLMIGNYEGTLSRGGSSRC